MNTLKAAQGQIWFTGEFNRFLTSSPAILLITEFDDLSTGYGHIHFAGSLRTNNHDEYTKVELIAIQEPDFSSGLAIRFEVSYMDQDENLQRKHMHWIATAKNAVTYANEVDRFVVTESIDETHTSHSLELVDMFSSLTIDEHNMLNKVTIQAPKTLNASNLFVNATDFGSQTATINRIRRQLDSHLSFSLIVKDSRVQERMNLLKVQMKRQINTGFEKMWFITKEAYYESKSAKAPFGISTRALRHERFRRGFEYLARTSFASVEEFLMVTILGVEREHQLDSEEPLEEKHLPTRFYEIPHDERHGRFIFALPLTQRHQASAEQVRLQKGDTFHLEPSINDKANNKPGDKTSNRRNTQFRFHCQVERCDSVDDGRAVIIGIIEHYKSTSGSDYIRPMEYYGSQTDFDLAKANLKNALRSKNARPTDIRLKFSSTTRDFQIQCLERWQDLVAKGDLHGVTMRDIVLGNRLEQLPQIDMLGGLKGSEGEVEDYLEQIFEDSTSPEQRAARKLIRSANGGVFLIDGCAGSGKSRFTRRVMLAHMFREKSDGEYAKITVPVAQNETGNTIVRRLLEDAKLMKTKLKTEHQPIILRAHKITAERNMHQGQSHTLQTNPKAKPQFDDSLRVDNALVEALQKETRRPAMKLYRINNTKVSEREHSVGWLMAKLLGLKAAEGSFPFVKTDPSYKRLRKWFIDYHITGRWGKYDKENKDEHDKENEDEHSKENEDEHSKENEDEHSKENEDEHDEENEDLMTRITDDYERLLEHAISLANILVFTTTQAMDPAYRDNFNAELMVIDEASQVNDAEFAALQAAYQNTDKFILAGDCKQLGVFSKDRAGNPVLCQWKKSIHQRFRDLGYATATFYEQHRCTFDIAKLVSDVYYHGDIKAMPNSRDRYYSQAYRKLNEKSFGIDKNVVFIDIPHTKPDKRGTSRYCDETADAVVNLVEKLGEDEARNIFTLSPYKEQSLVHGRRLEQLAVQQPEYWKIENEELKVVSQTLMGIQGAENKICIMDLTIGERIGFLKDDGQTLVGCSRGSDALYIIGDVTKLKRMPNYRTHAIGRLVQYCKDEGLIWTGSLKPEA